MRSCVVYYVAMSCLVVALGCTDDPIEPVRNVAPDLTSNTLEVIKFTALASVVALPELLRMGRVAQGITYNPTPLIVVALIYLAMLWPLVRLLSRMERRMLAKR